MRSPFDTFSHKADEYLFFNREIQDKYKNSLTVDAKVNLLLVLHLLVFIRRFFQWFSISFEESYIFNASLKIFDVILLYLVEVL